jgi:hypothetical protein
MSSSDFNTKTDPQATRLRTAAETDARVRANPTKWITLPGASAVQKRANGVMPSYPGSVDSLVQSNPECIIRDYKPAYEFPSSVVQGTHRGPRYIWLVRLEAPTCSARRDIETASLRASERIRYVTGGEIDKKSPHAKVSFLESSDGEQYVTFGSQILAEILDSALSYEKAPGWVEWTLARNEDLENTVNVTSDSLGNVASIAGKTRTAISMKDEKRGS